MSIFHQPVKTGNRKLKGWSMKQSDKTPFFEERDGVFV